MDPCPGHKRAHASLARPELDFFDAYVAKGGVPAEFFYLPARHQGATDTLASPALPCAAPRRSATHAPSGAFRQSAASPPRPHLPAPLVRPPPPAASLPLAPVSPDSPSAFPAVLHHPFAQPSAASSLNHPPTLTLSHISLNRTRPLRKLKLYTQIAKRGKTALLSNINCRLSTPRIATPLVA